MSYVIILILVIAVSILLLKLCLMKQQLRKMAEQMEDQGENYVAVDFIDRDMEAIALCINKRVNLLQSTRAKARKGEQAMKASVSMISHDMRTPLTSVTGYLQLAEKNCTEEEVQQDIKIALDRARYCNRLVNDFFELSVIESSQYTPVMEKVNICEVVCEEILAGYLDFEKSGITPVFRQADEVICVWADRKLLTRVIQNLISNGIKYSTGNMIFSVLKENRAVLHISSSTSGTVDAEKIFDKFYRADNSRNSEGAGLGLYICRKFIEDMSGEISACSEENMLMIKIGLELC